MANNKILFATCCPLKAKSLTDPFSLPHAIILPAKEMVPIINPAKMISKVAPSKLPAAAYKLSCTNIGWVKC